MKHNVYYPAYSNKTLEDSFDSTLPGIETADLNHLLIHAVFPGRSESFVMKWLVVKVMYIFSSLIDWHVDQGELKSVSRRQETAGRCFTDQYNCMSKQTTRS